MRLRCTRRRMNFVGGEALARLKSPGRAGAPSAQVPKSNQLIL
jgi:hypothetical protein